MKKLLLLLGLILSMAAGAQQKADMLILNTGDTVRCIIQSTESGFYGIKKEDGTSAKIAKSMIAQVKIGVANFQASEGSIKALFNDTSCKPEINMLEFSETVSVEGVNKKELFSRAYIWIVETFRNANQVVQLKDEENGILICKGSVTYYGSLSTRGTIDFTLKIFIKDNKYKCTATDFYHDAIGHYSEGRNFENDFGYITTNVESPIVQEKNYGCFGPKLDFEPYSEWINLKRKCASQSQYMSCSLKKAMQKPTEIQSGKW